MPSQVHFSLRVEIPAVSAQVSSSISGDPQHGLDELERLIGLYTPIAGAVLLVDVSAESTAEQKRLMTAAAKLLPGQ